MVTRDLKKKCCTINKTYLFNLLKIFFHLTTTLKLVEYRDEIAAVRSASTVNKYFILISVALKVTMCVACFGVMDS